MDKTIQSREACDVINEYKSKKSLTAQDIIKCCLRLYQISSGDSFYDRREKLWKMRPGDVIFTKGTFQPLLSYAHIDDTLKGIKCGHMEEDELLSSKKKKQAPVVCSCRKWYLYYRTDEGKVKKVYPQWDGMTVIDGEMVGKVLNELREHKSVSELEAHFTEGYVSKDMVSGMMKEIRDTRCLKKRLSRHRNNCCV